MNGKTGHAKSAETKFADIKLTDSFTRKKLRFEPQDPTAVLIYGCGPTVYGLTHVGNARAFLTQDMVVRVLSYAGYGVRYVRNYTDIDDKIIARASVENLSSQALAKKYTAAFDDDMKALRVQTPHRCPKATESVDAIIKMIQDLQTRGHAYGLHKDGNHDVYFNVATFKNYGKLSGRSLEESEAGYRIDIDQGKINPGDFALWKSAKPGEPAWPSPWGMGRPGWHIECSAMIETHLGTTIDIHMGGIDLLFPHHENEIAQSEASHQKKLSRYWMHNGLLELDAVKMSKSLGNLVSTRDFLKDYGADVFRLLMLSHHYRSPLNFSNETISQAENLWKRLLKALLSKPSESPNESKTDSEKPAELLGLKERMQDALYDDFNTAKALGFMWAALRAVTRGPSQELWTEWTACVHEFNSIFAFDLNDPKASLAALEARQEARWGVDSSLRQWLDAKIQERQTFRAQKDFVSADKVRSEMEACGFTVMDNPHGSDWRKT